MTAIPGVIAAGAKWKLVWQGPDNADGIIGTKDGGLLFAQADASTSASIVVILNMQGPTRRERTGDEHALGAPSRVA